MPNSDLLSKAAENFFARPSQLCPEAMLYELHHLRDNLPLLATDHQSIQDLQCTRKFLDSVIDFINECGEVQKV